MEEELPIEQVSDNETKSQYWSVEKRTKRYEWLNEDLRVVIRQRQSPTPDEPLPNCPKGATGRPFGRKSRE